MNRRPWLVFGGMLVLALAAYWPCLRGQMIWDDDQHITKPELRSIAGLIRIWIEPGAVNQYYPLTHSAFWLQWQLWGDWTTGYHLVNVLLHAIAAFWVWRIVAELWHKEDGTRPHPGPLPGGEGAERAGLLAAGIFLLHPVHVESVAWITELKNTLSAVWYLLAMRVYLRWMGTPPAEPMAEGRKDNRTYWTAFGFFVLALLSKSVTATLPGAVLVIGWWKRGRLEWKRDIQPTLPFWAIGLVGGLFTAWVERHYIGARGDSFDFPAADRLIVAGRAAWFYLGKLIWPYPLSFIYPRWEIDSGRWTQWLGVIGIAAGVMAWGVYARRTGAAAIRGIAAGAMFFGGTLLPALGFVNVYPFRYSWVADHFQYLASLGVIVPAAWALARLPRAIGAAPLIALGFVSFNQSAHYQDLRTIFQSTLVHNPRCQLAYHNLGLYHLERGRNDLAEQYLYQCVHVDPDYHEGLSNLAMFQSARGQVQQAIENARRAVELHPGQPTYWINLGAVYHNAGMTQEAIAALDRAVRIAPNHLYAHQALGKALMKDGRIERAIEQYRLCISIDEANASAHNDLAVALQLKGDRPGALRQMRRALELDPANAAYQANLRFLQSGGADK